jgi:Uncharacterized protein conserved in bacteria (DUF2252)
MGALSNPLSGKEFVRTVADRRAAGRALRKEVPRSSHAEWSPVADRPDPISLLEEQNLTRQAQLVPIRYGRMAASPFGFLRGAAVVMALERHLGPSAYSSHGQRVVSGQHIIQAASDLFLGWTETDSIDFYIRQLRDMKLSVNIASLKPQRFIDYCRLCGWTLARAHARSGDPAEISGYLGRGDRFERAIAAFAETYADQTGQDHAALVAAVQSGRIPVEGTSPEIDGQGQ